MPPPYRPNDRPSTGPVLVHGARGEPLAWLPWLIHVLTEAAALEYQLLLTSFAASSLRRCPGDGLTGRHAETVRNWEALILRGRPRGNGPPRAGQQLRDPPIHVETSGDQAIVPRERHNQQTLVPWLGDPSGIEGRELVAA
jgi:hypothetical protein